MFVLSDGCRKNIVMKLSDAGLKVTPEDIKKAYYDVVNEGDEEIFNAVAQEELNSIHGNMIEELRNKETLSPDDIAFLQYMAGEFVPDENDDEDTVLDKYAEFLHNYLYTYKPEAQDIDPDINPEEEQIGIMAQDLEKVNPACVKEVNGAKVVDTGKLALMNAGALGDVARRLKALEEKMGVS